jgi:hypothetical protein
MTSLFLWAVANLRSAAQSAATQAAQPSPVPAAPVVWQSRVVSDKRNEEELKRIIPLSFSPPTSLDPIPYTHVYPRGGVAAATTRRRPGMGLVGAPGRARGIGVVFDTRKGSFRYKNS